MYKCIYTYTYEYVWELESEVFDCRKWGFKEISLHDNCATQLNCCSHLNEQRPSCCDHFDTTFEVKHYDVELSRNSNGF